MRFAVGPPPAHRPPAPTVNGADGAWGQLAGLDGDGDPRTATLPRICRAAPSLVGVSGAAVSVRGPGLPPSTAFASDAVSQRIEELQLLTGEGPCVDSAASGEAVLVADLADPRDARWPGFAAQAVDAGARAVFAFPLLVGKVRLGVVDLYRDSPGELRATQVADARVVADAAAAALLRQQDARPAGELDDYWWDLDTFYRVEVHQATGMLLAQLGVDAGEALLRLRAHAFQEGRPITDVARDIIARRLRLTP